MKNNSKRAISPTRDEDFPGWYQAVIKGAEMADSSAVRGCMIIRPWGYAIWELLKNDLDSRIKATGHQNCYFPLFIPLSYIEREAEHVEGFAKEMAVVTHHKVRQNADGKLEPASPLSEPLIVRPTSETIFGETLSKWINSYRDLPVLLNQWANVVRWEMRPRMFLRTSEFLWQEGHTVHASQDEAEEETLKMIHVYQDFMIETLAVPTHLGFKSPLERFPGAVETYSVEAVMQDGKALQAGTSHYLGQNFSKSFNIDFQDKNGKQQYSFTTSWGVSSRLIGALIMTHADDDGLRLPSAVSPYHIVIISLSKNNDIQRTMEIESYIENIKASLASKKLDSGNLRVHIDCRHISPQKKRWDWIMKGVCIICEVGSRDVESNVVTYTHRHSQSFNKITISTDNFPDEIVSVINKSDDILLTQANKLNERKIEKNLTNWDQIVSFYSNKNSNFAQSPGLAEVWCNLTKETEVKLKTIGLTIRNVPLNQGLETGACAISGQTTTQKALIGYSY